jgi:hypothetical protein
MMFDRNNMSCEEFQAQMAELIGSGEDLSVHPHVLTCTRCRTLLNELEIIAEAARQLFPVVDPPDTLWDKLESAIKQEGDPTRG